MKNMKKVSKLISFTAVLLVGAFIITGCQSNNKPKTPETPQTNQPTEPNQSAQPAQTPKKIAVISPIPKGDPFIDLAYSGIVKLSQDTGAEVKIIEALSKSEYVDQVRAMSELKYDAVFVFWGDLADAVKTVAPEFPDTKFVICDTYVDWDMPNVKSIVVEPTEASFIAGYVAAKTTESKKVAFIGSTDSPVINKFKIGFEQGVAYGDPDVKLESTYIGTPEDPVKGQEIGKLTIGNGADVIMQAANRSGLGVIKACEEMNVKAIGADDWQGSINEKIVFWSALKDIAGSMYDTGKSIIDGNFASGMTEYGIASGIAMYDQRDYDKLPDSLKAEVDQLVKDMQDGKVKVQQ